MIIAPVSYQGGKQRISKKIIDIINPSFDNSFYDLCCGSGSISIELINRGFDPSQLPLPQGEGLGICLN
jgi:site-specific DNA-adenine methylase